MEDWIVGMEFDHFLLYFRIDVLDWFISTEHACMSSSAQTRVHHGRLVGMSYTTVHRLANVSSL
jgi:hypothetical protein